LISRDIAAAFDRCEVVDISQSISTRSASFPGDTAFSYQVTMSYSDSKLANVSALTMSPHVGTHADAPNHIEGIIADSPQSIGRLPLKPYIGPVNVVDLSPFHGPISSESIAALLANGGDLQKRILFKTRIQTPFEQFQNDYAFFTPGLIESLADLGVELIGIDTPSVDQVDSQELPVHHKLRERNMYWLENLDLSDVKEDIYCLVAQPLKFVELEASPVRALLLNFGDTVDSSS
jgi:arylformamidase